MGLPATVDHTRPDVYPNAPRLAPTTRVTHTSGATRQRLRSVSWARRRRRCLIPTPLGHAYTCRQGCAAPVCLLVCSPCAWILACLFVWFVFSCLCLLWGCQLACRRPVTRMPDRFTTGRRSSEGMAFTCNASWKPPFWRFCWRRGIIPPHAVAPSTDGRAALIQPPSPGQARRRNMPTHGLRPPGANPPYDTYRSNAEYLTNCPAPTVGLHWFFLAQ